MDKLIEMVFSQLIVCAKTCNSCLQRNDNDAEHCSRCGNALQP